MEKQVKIIGSGMDGRATLTDAASAALAAADVVIGARRVTDSLKSYGKPLFISYKPEEIAEYISECPYDNIAVIMSGDTGFYSGADGLAGRLPDCDVEIIPGISSPSYFFAKLKLPWQDAKFVSLHGRSAGIATHVRMNRLTFFLLGGDITAADVCLRLCEYGLGDATVHIGENLAMQGERITSGAAKDLTDIKTDNLCVLLAENHDYEQGIRSGIPDYEFVRGSVPMTKSEIRAICVSKLDIGKNDICWDIGCGTGSVSVEMAIRCPDGAVYAVDCSAAAAELTDKNRKKFGCDNIEIIRSDAVLSIPSLPSPDRVFIGGSCGKIEEILSAAYEKNPSAHIVAAAVSFETLHLCMDAFERLGRKCEITQVAITRTRKVGTHTMMSAKNPIFIIGGGGQCES